MGTINEGKIGRTMQMQSNDMQKNFLVDVCVGYFTGSSKQAGDADQGQTASYLSDLRLHVCRQKNVHQQILPMTVKELSLHTQGVFSCA